MRALTFDAFGGPLRVRDVPDPEPAVDGVVLTVGASGVCRSDWHGWQGHDPDIALPHVPGHELAGTVAEVGAGVRRWRVGDRVTVPFVCACGRCPACAAGDQQVCSAQSQPGFTHWGSFAQQVALAAADVNLVRLPDGVSFATAAGLGCRVGTAWRAVVSQGRVRPGQWVAVHGCGGVGLSAVLIAVAAGARVVAVDVSPGALALALELGAEVAIQADGVGEVAGGGVAGGGVTADGLTDGGVVHRGIVGEEGEAVAAAVRAATGGGAHVSLDALGSAATLTGSVRSLRARGRHVQVGLLPPSQGRPLVPMDRVVALELEILGSHGMPAHDYPELLGLISSGRLPLERLVTRELSLEEAGTALRDIGRLPGMAVVTRF